MHLAVSHSSILALSAAQSILLSKAFPPHISAELRITFYILRPTSNVGSAVISNYSARMAGEWPVITAECLCVSFVYTSRGKKNNELP